MNSYKTLSDQNKYLYGQLEHCTLMMGHALIHNQQDKYKEYKLTRKQINEMIERNLNDIEDIWNTPARPANRPKLALMNFEAVIIRFHKRNPGLSVLEIAKKLKRSQSIVETTITRYINHKYSNEDRKEVKAA